MCLGGKMGSAGSREIVCRWLSFLARKVWMYMYYGICKCNLEAHIVCECKLWIVPQPLPFAWRQSWQLRLRRGGEGDCTNNVSVSAVLNEEP